MPSCSSCPPLAETVTVGQALETVTHFLDLQASIAPEAKAQHR